MSNKSLGFAVSIVALSFTENLSSIHAWTYNADLDPVVDGEYTTLGGEAINYQVSIGDGRGSARLNFQTDCFETLSETMNKWDAEATLADLSPAECFQRTAALEDGVMTFKLSLAPNSRQITIPKGEWDNFKQYVSDCSGSVEAAVTHYRNIQEALTPTPAPPAVEPPPVVDPAPAIDPPAAVDPAPSASAPAASAVSAKAPKKAKKARKPKAARVS